MYRYSIIIPYRDTYGTLLTAVESIPDRGDIEILIVDNSEAPLDDSLVPTKSHASVVYLRSESNLGAGRARNVGLSAASGEFILFLDADDYFTEDAFEAFDRYSGPQNDIVYFKANSIKVPSGHPSSRHLRICNLVDDYLRTGNSDILRYKFENPVCKLFKADFLKESNVLFDVIRCANDTMFSIKTGHLAQSISAIDKQVYIITESENGGTLTDKTSKENNFVRFTVTVRQNRFYKSVGKPEYRLRVSTLLAKVLFKYGIKEFARYILYYCKNYSNEAV